MTTTRAEGNVIHADFGKPRAVAELTVEIRSDILYQDDKVMLVRSHLAVNGMSNTTHFLAYRDTETVEVIPVADA